MTENAAKCLKCGRLFDSQLAVYDCDHRSDDVKPYTREELDDLDARVSQHNDALWIRRLLATAKAGLEDSARLVELANAIVRVDWDCSRSPGHPGLDEAKELASEILVRKCSGRQTSDGETK